MGASCPERFDVSYLLTRSNEFDTGSSRCAAERVSSLRDRLPGGRARRAWPRGRRASATSPTPTPPTPRPTSSTPRSCRSGSRPTRRAASGATAIKLVQTVWETLPFLRAYRNRARAPATATRCWRRPTCSSPATERAREALLLEGVAEERIAGLPAGHRRRALRRAGRRAARPSTWSCRPGGWSGRRATRTCCAPWRCSTRRGPARRACGSSGAARGGAAARATPRSSGIGDRVEIGAAALRGDAERVRLGLLHGAGEPAVARPAQLHPFDVPRAFWEEQFGMVLAEAMAAGPRHPRGRERRDPGGAAGAGHAVRLRRLARARAHARRGPAQPPAGRAGRLPARARAAATRPRRWPSAWRPPTSACWRASAAQPARTASTSTLVASRFSSGTRREQAVERPDRPPTAARRADGRASAAACWPGATSTHVEAAGGPPRRAPRRRSRACRAGSWPW